MTSYSRITKDLLGSSPYIDLSRWLPHVPLSSRKAILTLCRVQSPFWKETSSRAWTRLRQDLQTRLIEPSTYESINLVDLISEFPFESSVFSGLLSSLIRSAPLNAVEAANAKLEAYEKEATAAMTISHPRCFRWPAVLSPDFNIRSTTRFHDTLPHNPRINHEIYARLSGAILRMKEHLFIPDYSRKTLGRKATQIMESTGPFLQAETEDAFGTTQGLEWLYSRNGNKLQGETELRLAWKWNDLKPRVYYARGPSQYYASRYIQEIFNQLIDSLPITNRFMRFFHSGIRLDQDDNLYIYDYSSFTSSLEEVKCFLRELAATCSGQMVQVLDTYHGILVVDLGKVIEDFLEECNDFPAFDINRFPEEIVNDDPIRRNSTGMLGVPGNITSSTLVHGIHLAIILESLIKGKCVGDDAIAATPKDEKTFEEDIQGLGGVSMTKGASWLSCDKYLMEDFTWNYVKRPLDRMDDRIVVGDMLTFPTIGAFFNIKDGIHTHIPLDTLTLSMRQATMLWRLCQSIDELGRELDADEEEIVDQFVYTMYRWSRNTLAHGSYKHHPIVVPRGYQRKIWKRSMLIDVWNDSVLIPKGDFGDFVQPEIFREIEIETRSSKLIKVCKDMGWAEVLPLYEHRIPSLDFDFFERWLNRELRQHVKLFLKPSCPEYMVGLLNNQSRMTCTQQVVLYGVDDEDDDYDML